MIVPYPPVLPTTSNTDLPRTTKKRIAEWRKKVKTSWSVLHLSSRGGQYSIERMLALEEYTRNTSLLHAVLVCVAAPLPAILFAIFQELLSLQNPAAGWSVNYGFWVRVFIVAAVIASNFIVHATYMVSGCIVSARQFIALVLCVSTLETAFAVAVAAYIWFPIPFGLLLMAPPFYPLLLALFYAIVGLPVIREMRKHSDDFLRYINYSSVQQMMAVIYPAYQVLFHSASKTNYELPVILLLPVLKLIVKYLFVLCVTHMEDSMPEAVIFSVDYFNALYLSTSMESASSTLTVVSIVLIHIGQSVIALYRLHQRTTTILTRMNCATGIIESGNSLLTTTRCLCEKMDHFQKQNRDKVHIRSCLIHSASTDTGKLLRSLAKIPYLPALETIRRHTAPIQNALSTEAISFENRHKLTKTLTVSQIAPLSPHLSPTMLDLLNNRVETSTTYDSHALSDSLEVLFTTECLVLGAYLDAVVPLLYGIFLLVMVHLPNAKYHTDLVGVTLENIGGRVHPVFSYFLVESVSLGLLFMMTYRNLRVQSVYQLAFVLETQWKQIQAKMFGWILMTMAFRLVHFGVDFTFQFTWIKSQQNHNVLGRT